MSKIKGRPLAELEGLKIYAGLRPSKRGKDRIWITITQDRKPYRWLMSSALAYTRSPRICFKEEMSKI